ncbi:phosphodiester glycosidase family protein [Streptantibioticus rubrisoli]|uniref:Phosphodiester glycosidase family protein n=1 Tax=Streptantibioticus rubrisoli TaxID=1387313 RepID=A0ABT1P8F9_9ACTN|nr:phosphodiester glycosidase family protein [Streptantibioticus rubrisoli]MCQ4041642.1 phosphodiester glycosidase family protein [Streptantibioticus rubrisoli]
MRPRPRRLRTALAVLAACGALLAEAGTSTAQAAPAVSLRAGAQGVIAPGVRYEEFSVRASHGTVYGHLLIADLTNRHVSVDLLTPGAVAAREPLSAMADARGAVAGVNGDFFDISEVQHPGVVATGAAVGPAVEDGVPVKAAVPDGQRFGPPLPPGTSTRDVIAVGDNRVARLARLTFSGSVSTADGTIPLRGFNQYALPVGGVGVYTSRWGTVSRERAVCGTDRLRAARCSREAYEVTVRGGRVTAVSSRPGAGAVPRDGFVLVGRDGGARALRRLRPGSRVRLSDGLSGAAGLRFAVGGFPVLRGGSPLAGLDAVVAATRSAAGFGAGGRRLYLLALDGDAERDAGLTIAELASVMRQLGAESAVDLDGGGSSTLVARAPGSHRVTVRNHPSGGAERPVPEGVGLFSR